MACALHPVDPLSLTIMREQPLLSVIIPAYNEQSRLEPTVREAVEYFRSPPRSVEIIVVDDGSRDGTSDLTRRLAAEFPEVRLIRLAANSGKGYAVRTGVVNAHGRLVLFMDADGATPIAEYERLEQAITNGAAIAIGSRAMRGHGVRVRARLYRRVIGRLFHGLVRTLTVRGIADTQCGFKLFRGDVAHELFSRMRMTGFSFDVEVLVMAQQRGHRIAETPVNWTHKPGSRVNLVRDSARMAYDLVLIRANVLRGNYDAPHVAPLGGADQPPRPETDGQKGRPAEGLENRRAEGETMAVSY
jgi:dolichyl-phosphate beta-glucosyltransferase